MSYPRGKNDLPPIYPGEHLKVTKKYKIKDLPIFDTSKHLDDEESIAIYLDLTLKEGDPAELQHVQSGISREALYRALTSICK